MNTKSLQRYSESTVLTSRLCLLESHAHLPRTFKVHEAVLNIFSTFRGDSRAVRKLLCRRELCREEIRSRRCAPSDRSVPEVYR